MSVILKDSYKVLCTYKYYIFKKLVGNRLVGNRKKKIEASINEIGYVPVPIIINEKNEVIDGQGRLSVCEERNLPIYYMVVAGLGLKDCVAMNANSTRWSQDDFINSFSELGDRNYIILKSFLERYKKKLTLDVITYSLSEITGYRECIKNGTFKVKQRCLEDADDLCRYLIDTTQDVQIPGRKGNLEIALAWCYRNKDIDNDCLKKVVREKSHTFKSYSSVSDWLKAIEEIYNFKRSSANRRKIHAMWELDESRKGRDE